MKKYTIGEVSEITGLSSHTLRYYEKEGIIEIGRRGGSGVREYSGEDIDLLEYIRTLKGIGFSLEEIRSYTRLKRDDRGTLVQRRKLLLEHRRRLEEQIQTLKVMRGSIEKKILCIDRRILDDKD